MKEKKNFDYEFGRKEPEGNLKGCNQKYGWFERLRHDSMRAQSRP